MAGGLGRRFRRRFDDLAGIGRDPGGGGITRLAWTPEDAAARDWFRREARALGLGVDQDGNANLWAWWEGPGGGAVATGSHLDTVADGGAYDGALGVVSALTAVEELQRAGRRPRRPLAVAVFTDEEGARFDTPVFGSGLLAGAHDPGPLLLRRDAAGVELADAVRSAGHDPGRLGADPARLAAVDAVVELHVEQGRALADLGAPVAVGTGIRPHGRWRLEALGEANHAGTTRMADRRDPMRVLAAAVAAAWEVAGPDAVATVGKVAVSPNGANAVPARVTAWLDARAADEAALDALVAAWRGAVESAGAGAGVKVRIAAESRSRGVAFDADLGDRIRAALGGDAGRVPALETAAGHDAGALAAAVPAAMLFVRNPTGVSHSPAESATEGDCLAGVRALTRVLGDLACA